MKEEAGNSAWGALHDAKEAKRLQLVALAAEVATVASRIREQNARLPARRRDAQLERECRALESAGLQMLFPPTRSHELSERELEVALGLFMGHQQHVAELMARANHSQGRISRLGHWMSGLR